MILTVVRLVDARSRTSLARTRGRFLRRVVTCGSRDVDAQRLPPFREVDSELEVQLKLIFFILREGLRMCECVYVCM